MGTISGKISLRGVYNIPDMIKIISYIFTLPKNSEHNISLDVDKKMVAPEYLAIIVSAYNYAKQNKIKLNFIFKEAKNDYIKRVNFYKLLDINVKESFLRRNSVGKFTEITPLPFDNLNSKPIDISIANKIVRIIRDNFEVEESIYKSLNYCLWEQISNIEQHSGASGIGYTIAQNFPLTNKLCICVVDTGIGIHESLTKFKNTKFSSLNVKQSLQRCIEKNVTNGTGMGNGLYHSTEFIKENKGYFIIYSGNYYIEIIDGKLYEVKRGAYWQGTIVLQYIKTNNQVDYEKVFTNCDVPDSVVDCDDFLDEIWG